VHVWQRTYAGTLYGYGVKVCPLDEVQVVKCYGIKKKNVEHWEGEYVVQAHRYMKQAVATVLYYSHVKYCYVAAA